MKLKPNTRIVELATSPLLDDLDGAALVVYLRLVGASAKLGRRMTIKNQALHRHPRTAARVMRALEKAKLIRVKFARTVGGGGGRVRVVDLA